MEDAGLAKLDLDEDVADCLNLLEQCPWLVQLQNFRTVRNPAHVC